MGSTESFNNREASMIQSISVLLLVANYVCALPPPPEYPTPAPTQEYNPDIGQTNVGGYGVNKDPYCHMVEKVVFENQCEPYTEQTCWTQNQEECKPAMYKNCTGVIETNIQRTEVLHWEGQSLRYNVQN